VGGGSLINLSDGEADVPPLMTISLGMKDGFQKTGRGPDHAPGWDGGARKSLNGGSKKTTMDISSKKELKSAK